MAGSGPAPAIPVVISAAGLSGGNRALSALCRRRRIGEDRSGDNTFMMRLWLIASVTISLAGLAGCAPTFSEKAAHGIVFYCPGAGNTDFGDANVRRGLEQAGYSGEVASFLWTLTFNVALDQELRGPARARATQLAGIIEDYAKQYPGQPINLVGLSAGTGIAMWAAEDLKNGVKVDNVVLLSSSLWNKFDAGPALKNIKGKVYVYYSPNDAVLAGPMKLFGSIDGVFGEDGAGAVGLHSPNGQDRIVNVPYRDDYAKFGYYGGHLDSTAPDFVRNYLASHLIKPATAQAPGETVAIGPR